MTWVSARGTILRPPDTVQAKYHKDLASGTPQKSAPNLDKNSDN